MGIFQKLGLSDAKSYESGLNYIAPKKIILKELFAELPGSIEKYYEEISEQIVSSILADYHKDQNMAELFQYVVREMIRNIFDHSQTKHFYYGSQLYPQKHTVEFVLADFGLGLAETVPFDIEEIYLKNDTPKHAIKKAILPGISAESNHAFAPEDYQNSGYGLAMVKNIIGKTDGIFSIATDDAAVSYRSSDEYVNTCNVNGTIIRMRINLEKLKDISFDDVLNETHLSSGAKGTNKKPSVASKSLSMKLTSELITEAKNIK